MVVELSWIWWWWFPVGWEFFGFAGVVAPGAGAGLVAFEQDEHIAHVVAPLALLDLAPTRLIDPPGLGVDRPLVSNRAAGAGDPQGFLPRPATPARCGCATGGSQLGKQVVSGGGGAIDPPGRAGPDDGAVGNFPGIQVCQRYSPLVMAHSLLTPLSKRRFKLLGSRTPTVGKRRAMRPTIPPPSPSRGHSLRARSSSNRRSVQRPRQQCEQPPCASRWHRRACDGRRRACDGRRRRRAP